MKFEQFITGNSVPCVPPDVIAVTDEDDEVGDEAKTTLLACSSSLFDDGTNKDFPGTEHCLLSSW